MNPNHLQEGLFYQGDCLSFKQGDTTYSIDFEQSFQQRRKWQATDCLLLRSLKGIMPCGPIVDTCCGWGDDLILLRTTFKQVIGIERHPILYALLKDAQRRFSLGGVEILFKDSRYYEGPGLAFYMDPMYPRPTRKKSKSHKRMELLKTLCGEDEDAEDLLQVLLAKRPQRVILKRPLKAPILFPRQISRSIKGKLIRFDIY